MADNMTRGIDDDKKLLVTGIGKLNAEMLCTYFMQFGVVNKVRVYCDSRGTPKGYAMVLFNNCNTVNRVLVGQQYHAIGRRRIYPKRFDSDGKITIHPSVRDIPDAWKIFVGGVTPYISDQDIWDYFSQFGRVLRVFRPVEAGTNRRKAYSIVTFANAHPVDYLVRYFNIGHVIRGKDIEVRTVFPKCRQGPVRNQRNVCLHDEHCGDLWTFANVQRNGRMGVNPPFAYNFRG